MANDTPLMIYAHRAKPFSNELELRLDGRSLAAEKGRSTQNFVLSGLERLRLSYSPRNAIRHAFTCELRASDGKSLKFDSISWKSLIDAERRDTEYRDFVTALVRRAAAVNPGLRLETGIGAWRYRLMLVLGFAIIAALLASTVFVALRSGWVMALITLGLAAYIGLWLREFLTRNRPRLFTPDALPEAVLPARR